MAQITADRVLETSTTTGVGSYTLAGAVVAFRAFSTVCANGDTVYYYAEDVDASGNPIGGWEVGIGTWGTGNILARTTIHYSSNANAAVSWSAGTRRIALSITATKLGTIGVAIISATAPALPVNGTLWQDLNTGVLYTYVDDGDSLQWVEIGGGNLITGSTSTIVDDTTTNATFYPLISSTSSGTPVFDTSSTKLTYNPSTGTLSSSSFSGSGSGITGTASSLSIGGTALNITGTLAVSQGGTGATTTTGTGANVLGTSPTLVTPNLGTPSALVGTNITGIPNTGLTNSSVTIGSTAISLGATVTSITGLSSIASTTFNKVTLTAPATGSTLTVSDGKTFAATNSITLSGTDGTTMTFPVASAAVGYLNIPQNSQSVAYTTVAADAGKHIYHPVGDANARTYTIAANASVPYDIGTAITFINMTAQVVTIAINTDTMYLGGTGTTGSRSLAQYGSATAIKMTATTWLISGVGLT